MDQDPILSSFLPTRHCL